MPVNLIQLNNPILNYQFYVMEVKDQVSSHQKLLSIIVVVLLLLLTQISLRARLSAIDMNTI
ncbi:hypothetical protein DERP_001545 [Dermatophagoides pteronyssinus]|uniref:Uncharacterized protein n=1 Tax=Dermatophagoides pteronyssinus TaxID=6956 RepID=A0ABQ8JBB4_DERPT|nr:hypothetical protein DERP_001545 [Dermatophagoides pteronyssinus]